MTKPSEGSICKRESAYLNHLSPIVAVTCAVVLLGGWASRTRAITITLDYTLDANNDNWFGGTPEGFARRAAVDSAAAFLSAIITNDDWDSLPTLDEFFDLTDVAASSITTIDGSMLVGTPESDGAGFEYTINTSNRSSVAANEYVIYVSAWAFDSSATAHAKAVWDSNDRRNAAGVAGDQFNTWGGHVQFDSGESWYAGLNPGVDPSDDYGRQDENKTPASDVSTDNWDWSTASDVWKGFDLESVDPGANGLFDLYATAVHELLHALGATTSKIEQHVGVDPVTGEFLGQHVMAEYGGPVPGDGGHFDNDVQATVWASDGIISEVSLDPNSLRSNRKYLTKLDAALLRDLGYDVLTAFSPADFNLDGLVDGDDLNRWQSSYGLNAAADFDDDADADGADFLGWQRRVVEMTASLASATTVPEPDLLTLLTGLALWRRRGRS